MSGRKNQSRANAAAAADEDAHNTLETQDELDSVMSAIRFGMESILKIATDTVPYCPNDKGSLKKEITDRMEASLLQLVEAELVYTQTNTIVNQVVEELALQENPDSEAKDFADGVDSISLLANQRIAEYKATLTPSILKSHPTFLQMKKKMIAEVNKRKEEAQNTPLITINVNVDNEDAETEEEMDMMDDEDDEEVIPELDPISKLPLTDPVRNSVCGHIYGKSSMIQCIKKNPRTRCPAMGCSNNQFVKISHLREDPALTARVAGGPSAPKMARLAQSPRAGPSNAKAKRGRRRR